MFERLQEIGETNSDLLQKLKAMFLEQAPDHLAHIENCISHNFDEETKRAAHTFKGVCLNLGADDMAETCKQIEDAGENGNFDQAQNLLEQLKTQYAEAEKFLETL